MIEAASYCIVSSPYQLPSWITPIAVLLIIIGGIYAFNRIKP